MPTDDVFTAAPVQLDNTGGATAEREQQPLRLGNANGTLTIGAEQEEQRHILIL